MPAITCGVCGKILPSPTEFLAHIRTHTGEKPFQCSICSKAFGHPSNLRRHERSHTGETRYNCENCGKRFTNKRNRDTHIKNNTCNRAYPCLNCPKSYTTARRLRIHRGKEHPNQGTSTVTTVHSQVEPTGIVMTTTQTITSLSSVTTISNIASSHGAACSVTQYMPAATLTTVIQEGVQTAVTDINDSPVRTVDEIFSALQHELLDDTAMGNESESNDPIEATDLLPDFWLD